MYCDYFYSCESFLYLFFFFDYFFFFLDVALQYTSSNNEGVRLFFFFFTPLLSSFSSSHEDPSCAASRKPFPRAVLAAACGTMRRQRPMLPARTAGDVPACTCACLGTSATGRRAVGALSARQANKMRLLEQHEHNNTGQGASCSLAHHCAAATPHVKVSPPAVNAEMLRRTSERPSYAIEAKLPLRR